MAKTNLKYTVLALLNKSAVGVMSAKKDQSEQVEFTVDNEKQTITIDDKVYSVDEKVLTAFAEARKHSKFISTNVPNAASIVLVLDEDTVKLESFKPTEVAKNADVSPAGIGERFSEHSVDGEVRHA